MMLRVCSLPCLSRGRFCFTRLLTRNFRNGFGMGTVLEVFILAAFMQLVTNSDFVYVYSVCIYVPTIRFNTFDMF